MSQTNSVIPTSASIVPTISQSRRARSDIAAIRATLINPGSCFMTREEVPARVLEVVRNPTSIKLSCEYVSNKGTKVRVRSLDSVVNQLASFLSLEEYQVMKVDMERLRAPTETPSNMPLSSFPPPAGAPLDIRAELASLKGSVSLLLDRIERIENSQAPVATEEVASA